jgi:GDP-4-dehydro-6-deoxy-D-mannose reductase
LRVLITGASGFAGGYLARACAQAGDEVFGVCRSGNLGGAEGHAFAVDLCDRPAVRDAFRRAAPEVVYHLAALSSVGRSWDDPATTVEQNVAGAVNVLEALRLDAPAARTVWVSTCEVYGTSAKLPIDESAPILPASPYAVSKAAGEQLAAVYGDAYGLEIIRARPFSHTGPGQRAIFIVSSLARQAAEARLAGEPHAHIATGNPETRRDFTDVRDVVRAYRLLAERAEPGVYNVCSGQSVSAGEQVQLLAEILAPIEVQHEVNSARVRAREVMDLRGSNERLARATGWQPEIPFRQTVSDVVEWWEHELLRSARVGDARTR